MQKGECFKKMQYSTAALEEKHISGLKGSSVCPIILITESLRMTLCLIQIYFTAVLANVSQFT